MNSVFCLSKKLGEHADLRLVELLDVEQLIGCSGALCSRLSPDSKGSYQIHGSIL